MTKIFCYELRRLLLNKLFIGILVVSMVYGWLTLTTVTILGTANTAPFSPWSFGDYLSRLLPMICLGELFFLTFFVSRQEQQAAVITKATPVSRRKYAAVRCGTVLVGTAVLALFIVGLCWVFYIRLFHWTDFTELLAPLVLILLPAVVFCLGLGWALGRVHPVLVYGLMAAVFLLSWAPLPQPLGFSLDSFFTDYPRTLGALDPAFSVPASVLCGRAAYLLIGGAAFLWSIENGHKRKKVGWYSHEYA